jgi:putative FmdB family regulatory protein
MPNYNYECNKCKHLWEDLLPISKRDQPTKEPCPKCSETGCVSKSWADCTPGLGADSTLTPNKATGGRWNELMNKMKAGAPPRLRHRFDQSNNMTGYRWKG